MPSDPATPSSSSRVGYSEALAEAADDPRSLGHAVLEQARRRPRATAIVDAGGQLDRQSLCAAALTLLPRLELAADERAVGVVLPPGRAGAVVNLALALAGRTAVNLNHTTGSEGLADMAERAGLRSVISARRYQERLGGVELPGRVIDVQPLITGLPKLALLWSLLKVRLRRPDALCSAQPDDVATIIFSSGSTGQPKGAELTHRQLLANFKAVPRHLEVIPEEDVLLSPLPLFHSFGYSTGLFLGLTQGITVAAHPDPRDGRGIGELAAASGATVLISTPTFVRGYLRRIEPEQFRNLRFAVVGAEKCPRELRERFRERYDAELYEGYGCTELAPVVSTNMPDKGEQRGSKDGSAGRPLPGIDIVIVDPESHEKLPQGEEGKIVVRSPARMRGYLHRPDLTDAAFIHDGYDTGDMGYLDDDGFLHITGRLARFAKIGGEMVPLELVQERLLEGLRERLGEHDHQLAVSAVPDEGRGERLVVLHDGVDLEPDELVDLTHDLPALFRPRAKDVYQVDELPVLGTGKLDLKGLQQLAREVAKADS